MSKKNDNRIIVNIFIIIKDLIDSLSNDTDILVEIEITTTNSIKYIIKLNSNNIYEVKINKNIIIIDNMALVLDDIVKLKVLDMNSSDEIRSLFIREMKNYILSETLQEYKNTSYYRGTNSISKEKNIEWYIQENKDDIKTVCFNCIKEKESINNIKNIEKNNVLGCKTYLDITKKPVICDVDINMEKSGAVTYIEEKKEKVIKDIKRDKKYVLTNNANEVNVAKPIKVEIVDVVTDIHIDESKLVTNKCKTKVVKDIKEEKLQAITDANNIYEDNIIGNINKDVHLIVPKTIDILFVEPSNKNINKEEVKDRYLTFDPTGENYIGVVLDDGTFEPLKVSMETITIVPKDVKNILVNVDEYENIVSHLVKDINYSKNKFINSLEVEYKDNVLEYDKNNEIKINEIISKSSKKINNVVNKDEIVSVVTKKDYELITGIKDIEYDLVSKVDNIKKEDMIKSVKLEKSKNDVIEEVILNEQSEPIISNIEDKNIMIPFKEDINGIIEAVGSGLMMVNNDDFGITIYSTSKISSIV